MDVAGIAARRDAVLARGRAAEEALMSSTCTVHRRSTATGETVRGRVVDTYTRVGENVPCRLKAGGSRKIDAGDVEREQATPEVHLPASWTDLEDDDLIVLTAGEWAETVYRVVEAVKGDQQTARRVKVEETDLPSELAP